MHHEISILGVFFPSLLVCAVLAGGGWLVVDGLMLRRGLWRYAFHPPLARLCLYIIALALVAATYPDF